MKRLLVCGMTVAALAFGSARTEAAILEIVDTFGGGTATWTLDSQTGCTVCATTLSVTFSADSGYVGTYLDSVQYGINGYSATNVVLNSTTAGTTADWFFDDVGVVTASGCNGGNENFVCGEWIGADAGLLVVGGATYSWDLTTTWDSALATSGLTGNIRGAFNNADGSNFNIFSPGGGSFDGDGGGTDGDGATSPEPATLLLFGLALSGAGFRMRRARA